MALPTIVYDLDGTLADTAGDLMGALNFVLEREGLAPLPVENARSLLGAGGRALIQRGFAASGRELSPREARILFGDFLAHYNAHIDVHTRLYPGVLAALDAFAAAGWRAGDLHQQDGGFGEDADRPARRRRPLRLHLRPGHLWGRQAGPEAADRHGRGRLAARPGARSWSATRRPTSRRRAPPACR